ncbi:MAG: hypothetical protein E7290_02125 [Lachnospiraceae bacterium]|nr:hypothetical protein [Lachnospiraceae bacterium]
MTEYTSGSSTVDAMASIQLTGNVIPQIWYKNILKETGKPDLLGIVLLADIVYWYRPVEVRDEVTGQVIGMKKKFSADLLQRNYEQLAEQFGESKRSVKDAMARLEKLGVIRRIFRTIETPSGVKCNNVLFIELIPQRLHEITHGGEVNTPMTKKRHRSDEKPPTLCQKNVIGVSQNRHTNTEITTEITTEIISSSPKPPSQDEGTDDDDDIKARVGYQRVSKEYPTIARIALEELVKDNNRKLPITENMFLSVCRNVEEHSGEIANVSAYVGTCLNNIVAGHEISKSPPKRNAFSCFSQTKYSDREWEQLEEQLLAN